eukprot:g2830.t1
MARSSFAAVPELIVEDSDLNSPFNLNYTVLKGFGGTNRNGYLGVFDGGVSAFSVFPPAGHDCASGVTKTSVTARAHDCLFAVNGGPFTVKKGGCIGAVISNNETVASSFSATGNAMFGKTTDGKWVIGNVANASFAQHLHIDQLITGFGWLVFNGSSVAGPNTGEQAPRTAVGIDFKGRLVVIEVDGCERCKDKTSRGPTLGTMGELLVSLNLKHAINLDGGGSSSCVLNGKLVNDATCLDVAFPKCERSVTTIICVGKQTKLILST